MKKIQTLSIAVIMIFVLVGCQLGGPTGIEAVKSAMRQGEYDAAVEEAMKIIENEPLNLEAWDLVAESYIENKDYSQANQWMEKYLKMIDDNLDNSDFNLAEAVDAVGDFGRDLLRDGQTPGDWYEKIAPAAISTDNLEWSYKVGDELTFDVPEGATLLYTLDGSSPKTSGEVYKDRIVLVEQGYIDLQLVVTNRYMEYSKVSYAYLDVYDDSYVVDDTDDTDTSDDVQEFGGDLELPELDLASGAYDTVINPMITNYDLSNYDYDIMYTLDGTDPTTYEGNIQYYFDGIPLTVGDHEINLVAYHYDSEVYSDVATYSYTVTDPASVKVAMYALPQIAYNSYLTLFNKATLEGIIIEPMLVEDLNNIDYSNLPDAVITYGDFAGELAVLGVAADISELYDLSAYDFFGDALKMGEVDGVQYMLPLTIRPEFMLYGDYGKIGVSTYEDMFVDSDWYEYPFMYPADSPHGFLAIYHGLGGSQVDFSGSLISLDRQKVEEALTFIATMPDQGYMEKLVTMEEMMSAVDSWEVQIFLSDDTMETYEGYYYSWYPLAGLPLPNGGQAKFYNIGTGIYTSALTATLSPDKVASIQALYDYLMDYNYDFATVAQGMASVPPVTSMNETMEFYSYIPINDFVAMVENGISENQGRIMYDYYQQLYGPLANLANGASVSEVADQIMAIE